MTFTALPRHRLPVVNFTCLQQSNRSTEFVGGGSFEGRGTPDPPRVFWSYMQYSVHFSAVSQLKCFLFNIIFGLGCCKNCTFFIKLQFYARKIKSKTSLKNIFRIRPYISSFWAGYLSWPLLGGARPVHACVSATAADSSMSPLSDQDRRYLADKLCKRSPSPSFKGTLHYPPLVNTTAHIYYIAMA
jgi:hypothetical protein